jgi:hypothetical protein
MKPDFELLHNDMLGDIRRCLELDHSEKENAESGFWIARNYWDKLQEIIAKNGFKGKEEEIEFYKVTKPQFASYIEYFSLLSEGLSFVPAWASPPEDFTGKDKGSWKRLWGESVNEYWTKEKERGIRHFNKHKEFLKYCESGRTEKDELYFLSRNKAFAEYSLLRPHNRDTDYFTLYEEIWTAWKGYQLYHSYIKKKVKEPVGS